MRPDAIVDTIEKATILDRPSDYAIQLLHKVLPAGRVKDWLSGTPLGHPAHPVMVTVPIGAWVGASVLDVVAGDQGHDSARRLVGLGTALAVPAVLTGASDLSDTADPERRIGVVHAAANYLAIGLYAGSWNARRHGRHAAGARRALLGAGVLGFAGWLGGHLAYAVGVGVDTTAFLSAPTEWTPVCELSELTEGAPLGATVGVVPILLVRHGGRIDALVDRCTHRGAPLHEGTLVGDCIECPWHESRFDLGNGRVQRGPATRPQPHLDVRIEDGRVYIRQPGEPHALRANPVAASALAAAKGSL